MGKVFDVDYLGTMTEEEIKSAESGFSSFEREEIDLLDINQEAEFITPVMVFNVRRIE